MRITRRQMLAGGAALALAGPAWAAETLQFGKVRIDTLSDGYLIQPADFIIGSAPAGPAAEILKRYGVGPDQLEPPCNVTLLRDGTNTVLFDVGSGSGFVPTAGKLGAALAALDLGVEDITHVVFTHGHPDHLWGVLDDFDEPLFANATHLMGRAEFDYWRDAETVNRIPSFRQSFAVGAKRRLDAMAERITMIEDGQEVLPGIAAQASFGHSPGHMAYEIRQGSEAAMVVGDAIANHHIAFEQPAWPSGTDQDADLGAKARARLLDRLASEKMAFVGFHLPGGGLGRAERHGSGYRYTTEL